MKTFFYIFLGQNQVEATALRLKQLNTKPKHIISSYSQDTFETTKIIYEHFRDTDLKFSKFLMEGLPVQPSPEFLYYSSVIFYIDSIRISYSHLMFR